jgi:hypothetical protein
MLYVCKRITGIPYGKSKTRGNVDAPAEWSKAVKEQTEDLPCIKEACILKLTFLLPPDKFPADFPYGPNLDNLVERFMDALGETIFREAHGGDSCVIAMHVMKTRVESTQESGAMLEILPVSVA